MPRLFTVILLAMLSMASHADTITAAGDPWPPFLDPDHPQQGVAIAIAREALESQGHELEFSFVPWARALDGVKAGDYDALIGTWWTQERTNFLMYSEPYLTNQIKFIKRKGDPFEFDGLKSLEGKTVGTVRGYGYGDDFANAEFFTRSPAPRLITNVRKVIHERLDLSLEDELVARSLINKEDPALMDKIEFTDSALSSEDLHVTSGLANPRHTMVIEAFNKGLKTIQANGTFDRILEENGLK
ncbi:transporter substrate-binding domain-containing protein [Marinobacter sp. CHS3-4]|uniref:substrate-binding periplasmic protein n=1 Tax=Marinobacter sp. CHS3-4 TaxID=3045174 RepID=UPI0024B58F73|nr:transporter substrate-binding domain-containing protein [Marinobacter sp. CHS3-4]MDI9244178.1 transporter substrate-binding domain-containing protein [Marinobacter sp. CHS3-4]